MSKETQNPPSCQTAVSGSALIAEFMEIKEVESYYDNYGRPEQIWYAGYLGYRTPIFNVKGKSVEHLIKENKFLHSWDWLMPVYSKIRDIINNRSKYDKDTITTLDLLKLDVQTAICEVDFDKAFNSIIKFISYWNVCQAER